MRLHRVLARLFFTLICFLLAGVPALAGDDWRPIDPAHLAMKAPVVEKDADAEVIFWEVRLNDSAQDLEFSNYIRVKVFTERGKESQSKIDIEYQGNYRIVDVAGRTIRPDGTIVELKKDAVFDRTLVKAYGVKYKAKSFAMPAVEPGVIIEYRWKEVRPYGSADYLRLEFQRDIPVQSVTYFIKPPRMGPTFGSPGMQVKTFNGDPSPFVKNKDGYYVSNLSNVPALHREPQMPPVDQVRTWMLVYYPLEKLSPPAQYWPKHAREFYEFTKSSVKVNDDVRKAAAAAIGDATSPEQKLKRLFDFCRAKIKNISDDASGMTESDLEKRKRNESPSDTLKRGMGTGQDIDFLFGALAAASGFEARLARLADRSRMFFDQSFTNSYFLDAYNIAIKMDGQWKFFDPAAMYLPFGMLRWQEEGMPALICDPKDGAFVTTPISPAEKSLQKRTATFTLSEDGSIEGDARIEYTGQFGAIMKEQDDDVSPGKREENFRNRFKAQMSTAELSEIKIENATDPDKPFVYAFHLRVPGYAQRTGKRLFLQPGFFRKGIGALFPASTRKLDIYFRYPWKEEDEITIELPAGFALDNADRPGPVKVVDVADYNVWMGVTPKGDALQYKRTFWFKGLVFPASSYAQLKHVFDLIHESDNHTITLKQGPAAQ